MVSDMIGGAVSVSLRTDSIALELRYYPWTFYSMKGRDMFVSVRASTRNNVSLGVGLSETNYFSPVFGAKYNIQDRTLKPFVSVGFYL